MLNFAQYFKKQNKWRQNNIPKPLFNRSLPVFLKKDEIIETIRNNRVVIIAGETGSGKTTQIPQFCLAADRGINGLIGCTQPRRIAAITVAARIAEELGETAVGGSVGYKIRFKDKTSKNSFIKIMTDGILLAETRNDPFLNMYDTLIVDEAHERSLNIDFVLGILKTLSKKRKDLKLIITSATIDTEKFSKAFDNAPVIEVSGRVYPVETRYFAGKHELNDELTHVEMAAQAVDELQSGSPFGDILIFMPTERDIHETRTLIEGRKYKGVFVLPLYARIPASEQKKIFARCPGRKIIIATNIAETSITIPGVKYVIDTGLARISHYMPGSRITSLPVVPVSQSSAEQRKGRCGRVENGICIRLFPEEDFNSRRLYTPPEILRANLAEVILKMLALNLGNIEDFPFIDPPEPKSIKDGFNLLIEIGAISSLQVLQKAKAPARRRRFKLTKYGRLMANMPVDPRLARILIEAGKYGCIQEMAIIASAMSIRDPRERPPEKAAAADQKHKEFVDPLSDFITLLNIWNTYNKTWQKVKTGNRMKKFCREYFLSYKRMREWVDIHSQLSNIIKEDKNNFQKKVEFSQTKSRQTDDDRHPLYEAIHKSILSGFLSNIALKKEKNFYKAAKGSEVMLFPGSGLFNKAGKWLVAFELIETTRPYARCVAAIDNAWIENAGKKQCKYTYNQPHWERNRGEVVAFEQVSLFGLIIITQRPVSYGRIDPAEAFKIFVNSALVQGDVKKILSFMQHNQELIEKIADMENRFRRRDILVSEEEMADFYMNRLPEIYSIRALEACIKTKGTDRFLRMETQDLLRYNPDTEELELFPDKISLGNIKFRCAYNFNIGKPNDGVTIKVPAALASSIPSESIDWLVPGLFKEKIAALIKGLPKKYRKKLVPIADTVDILIKEMPQGQESNPSSLFSSLGSLIYKRFKINIPASAWPDAGLPDHLKAVISITNEKGKEIRSSRDKAVLYDTASPQIDIRESKELRSIRKNWERSSIIEWNFPDLPESIPLNNKNMGNWAVYPALESMENKINLRIFNNPETALQSHKKGIIALFSILFSKDLKFLKKRMKIPANLQKAPSHFGSASSLANRFYQSVITSLFSKNIRSKKEFYSYAESVSSLILKKGDELLKTSIPVISAYHDTLLQIADFEKIQRFNEKNLLFLNGLSSEVKRLVPNNFMELYNTERLPHLVRYLKAISLRSQRAFIDINKDRARASLVTGYTDKLNSLLENLSPCTTKEKRSEVENFFWMIEEYKVSVFAQELKTVVPVSQKRLDTLLKKIERMI